MAETFKLGMTRIWTKSWESFAKLDPSSRVYGDLVIRVGGRTLEGVTVESRNGAELNIAGRHLIGLRTFPDNDSYTAAFQNLPLAEYEVERRGDTLIIELPKVKRAKRGERLECDYAQVQHEASEFSLKLKALLLEHVPADRAASWWFTNFLRQMDES